MTNNETIKLAKNLIKIKSITPDDAGCQDLVIEYLTALGFSITKLKFANVHNFFAIKKGVNSAKSLLLAGHTDVVPPGDISAWRTKPFVPTIIGKKLYGRGAADMKGALAAMLVATKNFITQHPKHSNDIGFLITADEEGEAINGTIKVCQYLVDHNINIDYCIIGEPSSTNLLGDIIKNGRRGSVTGFIKIIGKQGHVAYPHLSINPIHRVVPFLQQLTNTKWDDGNQYFDPTQMQVVSINAGAKANNVIPGNLNLTINLRYNNNHNWQNLTNKVERLLKQNDINYTVNWHHSGAPFITERKKLVNTSIKVCKEILNIDSKISTGGGTSDGRFIAPMLNAEVIELGPSNKTIHQVNEFVLVDDLINLTKVYTKIITKLVS